MTALPLGRSPKGKETVELRRATRNRLGDKVVTGTLATFTRCAAIPRTLGEDNDRGSVAIKGHTVYIPPQVGQWEAAVAEADREIKDTDQLKVRGEWTEIEGHPAIYVDLKGKVRGTFVTTRGEVTT